MDRSDETLNNICSLLERTLNVLTKCPALPFFLSKPLRILYFVNHVSKHLLSPLLIGSLSLNVLIRPNHSQDSLAFILFFSFFSLSNIQFSNEKSNIGSLLLYFQYLSIYFNDISSAFSRGTPRAFSSVLWASCRKKSIILHHMQWVSNHCSMWATALLLVLQLTLLQ